MANHPPKRCVVVVWDEDERTLVSYTLDVDNVRAVTRRAFPMDLPASDYDDRFGDEFARRFGAATLNLLALSNRGLKPLIQITPATD
jgi:hypothetical protein